RDLRSATRDRQPDGALHLPMQPKRPGHQPLAAAAPTSRNLEQSIRTELPEVARIDIHLEPMEPEVVPGEDVTGRRTQLATRMREIVESHPEVVCCLDVELSDRHHRIYAHVVAEVAGAISLEHEHAMESQLE